jgi:uncharacterized DUF497 family protein
MKYQWDENKNQTNIKKHGMGFKTASEIFKDFVFISQDNRKDYGEERFFAIGAVKKLLVIL